MPIRMFSLSEKANAMLCPIDRWKLAGVFVFGQAVYNLFEQECWESGMCQMLDQLSSGWIIFSLGHDLAFSQDGVLLNSSTIGF